MLAWLVRTVEDTVSETLYDRPLSLQCIAVIVLRSVFVETHKADVFALWSKLLTLGSVNRHL